MTPADARQTAQLLRDQAVALQNQATTNLMNAALLDKWADTMDVAHAQNFTDIMPQAVIDYYKNMPAPAADLPARGSPTVTVPAQVSDARLEAQFLNRVDSKLVQP